MDLYKHKHTEDQRNLFTSLWVMLPAETQTERMQEKHIYLFFSPSVCGGVCALPDDICSSDWIFNLSCKVNHDGSEVEMRGGEKGEGTAMIQ